MVGYLTKNESGISKLLKAVNDQAKGLSNFELIKEISAVLDKHREVSIQEAVYRLLSLPMTKSSIRVKYVSTIHPHFRDGLLRAKIEDLPDDDDSIFHTSLHQYYENRYQKCIPGVNYHDDEEGDSYWENLTLAEFIANYDIHYGKNEKDEFGNFKFIPLKNNKGCIKRRSEKCVIRYYLIRNNDEDVARSLLILFHPFENEMKDIHEKNVIELYNTHKKEVDKKRNMFEKHKVLTELINSIEREKHTPDEEEETTDTFIPEETTTTEEIESFEKWAKDKAKGELGKYKQLISSVTLESLREMIIKLNKQQRKIFDDFCERIICNDFEPIYLYIAGEAGTGKSFLLKLLIEVVKLLKLKAGDELEKPAAIVMAPTANAAYIINGKTIESSLGMLPRKRNTFVNIDRDKLSKFSFIYEAVDVVFCDEISMVGSNKFTKINFQLQDILCNNKFMGGLSFVAVGDLRQLPPVLDGYIYENNNLDGRPAISPSHWDEHFRIFYLTDKMRAQKDPEFASICDRVGNGKFTKSDIEYLKKCERNTENENSNDNFKDGKLAYIVTTNKRRNEVNEEKLDRLLINEASYESLAVDRCTNIENPPEVPNKLAVTQTGGLEKKLIVKQNAPIVITSNHHQAKYKEDGFVNGARGYIDSIQVSRDTPTEVDVIWVIFKDKNIGKRLKFDLRHLLKKHKPNNEEAVPILKQKKQFTINKGEVRYQRYQFPLTLAYAVTAYKCQGETLEEVIIDFFHEPGEIRSIQTGAFYVALTRVKQGKDVYLKSFDEKFITFNKRVEDKIDAMRKFKPYRYKKIYLFDSIYKDGEKEIKLGYFNMQGFLESNHAKYLDNDLNLLHLNFLVLSETWLTAGTKNKELIKKLENWKILKRLDATDNRKHMGLMLLTPKDMEKSVEMVYDMDYVEGYTNNNSSLLYQGLVMSLKKYYKKIVFLYIRKTPSMAESQNLAMEF